MRLIQGLALGDSILLAGAAVFLSKKLGALRVVCSPEWETSVKSFYVDHPNITVYTHLNETQTDQSIPRVIGDLIPSLGAGPMKWYEQLGVPFSACWIYNPITRITAAIPASPIPTVFVHDDPERGFVIPIDGYRPERTKSILDHVPMLKAATAIHCMRSAFFHLVESMPPLRAKLFLHRYAKAGYELPTVYDWKILDQPF